MKLKSAVALLAALCLIFLGAWLPRLAGQRQDARNENQVLFTQVQGVTLEFAESDLTMAETLSILMGARESVDIPQELASLKREKVEKIVGSTIEKYRDAGILLSDPTEDEILSCQTMLCYGPDRKSNVYWQVYYGDKEGSHAFIMTLDDRTGTICVMEYTDNASEYSADQMTAVLDGFLRLHLTGLGGTFFSADTASLLENAKAAQDYSYLATEYPWTDPTVPGKITFFVNRGGFYTYFS